jgi:hypothetical protein
VTALITIMIMATNAKEDHLIRKFIILIRNYGYVYFINCGAHANISRLTHRIIILRKELPVLTNNTDYFKGSNETQKAVKILIYYLDM